jgi:hypothetical protein
MVVAGEGGDEKRVYFQMGGVVVEKREGKFL